MVSFKKAKVMIERRRVLHAFTHYLKNGDYYIDSSNKCVFSIDDECQKYVHYCLRKKDFPVSLFRKIRIKKNNNTGKYIIILLSNSTNEIGEPLSIKLFNTDNLTILTKYSDSRIFMRDVTEYKYFKEYFSLPSQKEVNTQDMTITEKWIQSIPLSKWTSEVKKSIYIRLLKEYCNYYRAINSITISVDDLIYKSNIEDECFFLELILDTKNLDIYRKCPLMKQHGDLTFNNILFDGTSHYIIDFEHADRFYFLYDLFWILQNDFIYNQDSILLDDYLNGRFDELFNELFNAVHKQYDSCCRASYFKLFLIHMYINRIERISSENKQNAMASIKKLIDRLTRKESE